MGGKKRERERRYRDLLSLGRDGKGGRVERRHRLGRSGRDRSTVSIRRRIGESSRSETALVAIRRRLPDFGAAAVPFRSARPARRIAHLFPSPRFPATGDWETPAPCEQPPEGIRRLSVSLSRPNISRALWNPQVITLASKRASSTRACAKRDAEIPKYLRRAKTKPQDRRAKSSGRREGNLQFVVMLHVMSQIQIGRMLKLLLLLLLLLRVHSWMMMSLRRIQARGTQQGGALPK